MRLFLLSSVLIGLALPAAAECTHGTYPDGTEITICTGGERTGRDAANVRHEMTFGPFDRVHFVGDGEDRHEVHESVTLGGPVGNE